MQTHHDINAEKNRRMLPLDLPEFRVKCQEERPVTWSVPWSDLMMVMFILFLVLFVFALREKERIMPGHRTPISVSMASGSQERLNMRPFYELIRERLIGYERHVNIAFLEDASILISLYGADLFEKSSITITEQSRPVLSKIGQVVSLAQGRVVITGFAEDQANGKGQRSARGPWETAAVRAAVIAEHLASETGLDTHMLVIQATGADIPHIPLLFDSQNERQRWAEIRILPNRASAEQSLPPV